MYGAALRIPKPLSHPADSGQSLRAHLKTDEGLFADHEATIRFRVHAEARFLAESDRKSIRKMTRTMLPPDFSGAGVL
jgi:hypothetical protein